MIGGTSVMLTGMAGTGKSATLCHFIMKSHIPIDVTATTGIAALNVQDQYRKATGLGLPAYTIYRWAGIALGPKEKQPFEEYIEFMESRGSKSFERAKQRIRRCQILVIDEISMMPGRILDFLDHYFKYVRGNELPFGGIQMVFVGDFLQLPPVSKTGRYDWAFKCSSWNALAPLPIYLKEIHRQDEPEFIEALNSFRMGHISQKVADILAARVSMFTHRNVIRLFTHNSQVDRWNTIMIDALETEPQTFTAKYTGYDSDREWFIKNSITPEVLILKVGARVMVTTNISDGGGGVLAVNGQMGTVEALEAEAPVRIWVDKDDEENETGESGWQFKTILAPSVKLDNGELLPVVPFQWTMDPQDEFSPTMTQLPLRPAYAISIHKSQGLTLPSAHIDIRAAREPGQAYVALSRLKSLSGLHLKDWVKGVHVSNDAINFYKDL